MSLDRLTSVLFSKQQRLLFRHLNDQAFTQNDLKIVGKSKLTPMKPEKRSKAFHSLKYYTISSELDKRLVLGIFQSLEKMNKLPQNRHSNIKDSMRDISASRSIEFDTITQPS